MITSFWVYFHHIHLNVSNMVIFFWSGQFKFFNHLLSLEQSLENDYTWNISEIQSYSIFKNTSNQPHDETRQLLILGFSIATVECGGLNFQSPCQYYWSKFTLVYSCFLLLFQVHNHSSLFVHKRKEICVENGQLKVLFLNMIEF